MGLFSNYIKKVKRIGGKRISIFIDDQWEDEIKAFQNVIKAKNLESFLQIYKRYSYRELKEIGMTIIFDNFSDVVRESIQFVPFDSLFIYVKVGKFDNPTNARYIQDISKYNVAFFELNYIFLIYKIYEVIFNNNPDILRNIRIAFKDEYDLKISIKK